MTAAIDASAPQDETSRLDRALAELRDSARTFARLPPSEKATLLRRVAQGLFDTAGEQVRASCAAKGIDPASTRSGEEWLAGPFVSVAMARRLAESVEDIARGGKPRLAGRPRLSQQSGRYEARLYPPRGLDRLLASGRGDVLFLPGLGDADIEAARASFYQQRDPEGRVCLVLGAGNVSSIPICDVLFKMFVEGSVVLLKMNPVNAYLGPIFERALAPLAEKGFVRFAYGGADVGAYLSAHGSIDTIHITGSIETHDRIVFGPPGPEQARRKREGAPLCTKPVTSELGNISPVMIVPYLYDKRELVTMAKSLATQVVNNASFNCNAAKMLVLSSSWPQRAPFLAMLERTLASIPPRRAYYPGAFDRYARLTEGREARRSALPPGAEGECVPWTIVPGLDPRSTTEPLFRTEPFCGLLSEVTLESADAGEFLRKATEFCNDKLWGTLNASILHHPQSEEDFDVAAALERAIVELRYGAIGINVWPAVVYALPTLPWGGHPSASLADAQSGIGFVHNTQMLGGIEKTVFRAPLRTFLKHPVVYDNRVMDRLGAKLAAFEHEPSLSRAASAGITALFG